MKLYNIKFKWNLFLNSDKILKKYTEEDFIIQLKARFVFYLIIGFVAALLILIPITTIIQYNNLSNQGINRPLLMVELTLTIALVGYLYLVILGYFRIVSHLILVTVFVTIWLVLFLDNSNIVAKLDTIVYVLVVLSAAPILISSKKKFIIVYTFGNVLLLVVFSIIVNKIYVEFGKTIFDYLLDTTMAMIFIGLVAYNNFRINNTALEKANNDIKAREEAERLLALSEKKYREMTEFLPQTIFEADLSGRIIYVNKFGLEKYGFTINDVKKGHYITDTLDSADIHRAKDNIGKLIQTGKPQTNHYIVSKKDGTKFPVQISTSLLKEDDKVVGIRGVSIDISELKRAEKEIKESRDQFQSLVENIPGITYRCKLDDNWTMLFMSGEIESLCGYPSSDFIQNKERSFASVIHPDDSKSVTFVVENAILNNNPWEIEFRIIHRNGHIRWVYEKGRAIKDDKDNLLYLDGFIFDDTQRKTAEIALTASEARYKHLFMTAPIAFSSVNLTGEITMVNKVFTDTLGYTIEDIPTIDFWWDKAYPDDKYRNEVKDQWGKRIKNAIINKTLVEPGEYILTDKCGKEHTMIVGASVHTDYILASFIDITERKIAEKNLRQSEDRFRAMIELLPHSVFVSDMKGRLLIINDAFCNELDCTKDQALGKTPMELGYLVDQNTQNEVSYLLNKIGVAENLETTIIKKDKSISYVYFSCRLLQFNEQPVILSSSINITSKKQIENELEKYRLNLEQLVKERTDDLAVANEELLSANEEYQAINEELYEKNQIIKKQNDDLNSALKHLKETQSQLIHSEKMATLGVLTAGVAHEINNPLNFIMGGYIGLDNYLTEINKHNSTTAVLLESIKTGIERTSAIVSSLNQFSRDNEIQSENCDIQTIIDNCLVMLNNKIKNKISINKKYGPEHSIILGNVGKMHQVFLNLLNNAIQAIDDYGVIEISIDKQENNLIVEISDTGHGISRENLSKITDPFFTTKNAGEGTGLGLAITQNIIKDHNGQLKFVSEINKGTSVIVSLPLNTQQ